MHDEHELKQGTGIDSDNDSGSDGDRGYQCHNDGDWGSGMESGIGSDTESDKNVEGERVSE